MTTLLLEAFAYLFLAFGMPVLLACLYGYYLEEKRDASRNKVVK